MKKNNNAFTLIELLAVVTIIGLISVLVIPNILKNVKEKKEQISEANLKILEAATNMYIEKHPNLYTSTNEADGSTYCIAVQELVNDELLTTPFKNIDGEEIDYNKLIKATYNSTYNTFTYDSELYDNTTCTEIKNYINKPILVDNMIPVIYDNNTVKKADINTKWYSYTNKNWANAVLIKKEKSYYYETSKPGTTIEDEDILGYFVWIPRFKYQLFNSNERTEINIIFESVGTSKSTGTETNEWLTHPAFTYNKELSGIWVGKYESSNSDDNVVIKPTETPWTNISYDDAKVKALKMSDSNNIYGIEKINTHMMYNSEWGAVAYLTNSKYGLNDTVTNETSTTGNITGIFNMVGNKEFVVLSDETENSLGYALTETKNWTNNTNTFIDNENPYLTRSGTTIFDYNNTNQENMDTTFRVVINTEAK